MNLNQLLADTMTLRDMYKKHHWQVVRADVLPAALLFDKHYEEQNKLVDADRRADPAAGRISHRHGPRRRGDDVIPAPKRP